MYFTKIIDDEKLNIGLVHHIDEYFDNQKNTSNNFSKQYETTGAMGHLKPFQKLARMSIDFAIEKSTEHYKFSFESFWDIYYPLYIESFKCSGVWGRRETSGNNIKLHNHFPATWAFAYYIDPPEGSSSLYLKEPDVEIPTEHGLLILFKGDINHETRSCDFDGYRYCVSGNILPRPPLWPEVANV